MNSFETNYKLFKQFMDKTSQIQPILKINEITEEFFKIWFEKFIRRN
ncbi:MAG: hypothetical protein ACLU5J_09630 [Christensenellales bacterium]